MRKYSFVIFVCLLLTSVLFASHANDDGQGQIAQPALGGLPTYRGIDVLFVVDLSGSMTGNWDYPATDPQHLRLYGPDLAVRQILTTLQQSIIQAQPVKINSSAIGFGTTTQILLPWTAIRADTDAEWQNLKTSLTQQLRNTSLETANLGDTDIIEAFSLANRMFEDLNRLPDLAPSAGEQHLRVVVLVTDGGPCSSVRIDAEIFPCNNDPHETQMMNMLHPLSQRYFPSPNYRTYIVALSPTGIDSKVQFWNRLETRWTALVCGNDPNCSPLRAHKVETGEQMGAHLVMVFNEIVKEILPGYFESIEIDLDKPFNVPPYRQNFTLNIFKNSSVPIQLLNLIRPDQNPELNYEVQGEDTPIQSYIVQSPIPGDWQITVDPAERAKVTSMLLVANFLTVGVKGDVSSNAYNNSPLDIAVDLVSQNGQPAEIYQAVDGSEIYPITINLVFYDAIEPNRDQRLPIPNLPQLTLPRTSTINLHEYGIEWIPQQAGRYEVRANVFYRDDNLPGQPMTLLLAEQSLGEIVVSPTDFQWLGLNKTSIVEDETVTLSANLVSQMGGVIVPMATGTYVEARVLSHSTGNEDVYQLIDNINPVDSDTLTVAFPFLPPDEYTIYVHMRSADSQILSGEVSYPLVVRPAIPLDITFNLPNRESMPAQILELAPRPRFSLSSPLTVEVVIRDQMANPVSLGAISNSSSPSITMKNGNDTTDISSQFVEVSAGRYIAHFDDLGQGTYVFQAQVIDQIHEGLDYRWNMMTAQVSINRHFNIWILISILTVLVIFGLASGLAYYFYRVHEQRTKNPLRGTLQISRHDGGVVTDNRKVNLQVFNTNFKTLTARHGLPKGLTKLTISTNGDEEMSKNAQAYLKQIVINKKELRDWGNDYINNRPTTFLDPDRPNTIYYISLNSSDVSVDYTGSWDD